MKRKDFMNLVTIKDGEQLATYDFEKGDTFLYGKNVIDQVNEKKKGENITYYKIINIKENGNLIYSPVIDKMED